MTVAIAPANAAPIARYTFDDADIIGTAAQVDKIGTSNTSEPLSAVSTGVVGRYGQSYSFGGGANNLMTLPSGVVPAGATARTISIWFHQISETSGQDKIIGYGGTSPGTSLDLSLEDGGVRLRHYGGNITYGSGFDFDGSDAGWHHLAIRVNAGASTFADVDVFLNGNLLPVTATASGGTTTAINTTDSTFGIGTSTVTDTQGFNGRLDELQIYDQALSNSVIASLAGLETVPPAITGSDIIDDQGGNIIGVGTRVTYTLNFSEDIDANTVGSEDFNNAGTSNISFGDIVETSSGVFKVEVTPTSTGSLQLRIPESAIIEDLAGNRLVSDPAIIDNTTITVNGDTTAPTLTGSDIVDDRGGARISIGTVVTYTITFNEDIDASSVDAADFTNAGTSAISIGAISETLPGVFHVDVTPNTSGTLQLSTSSTASIMNPSGLTLIADPAITDDTIITVVERPPNIVIFFLDDFGWADWEQNGDSTGSVFYETPNMNRMATEGLYFTNGYASSPVCSPTRAALMTGQAPAYNKVTDWISGRGDSGEPIREAVWTKKLELHRSTFAEELANSGYRTIYVGKWHLGTSGTAEANPINHGFAINIGGNHHGTPPGPERYFASANGFSGLPNLDASVAPQGSYLTDVLTAQAVEQIQDAVENDVPFLLCLAHYAVHTPIQAPASTVQKYQDKKNNNPGTDWMGHTNATYAAMIEHVDLSLGEILATIEDPDGNPNTDDSVASNTMVVFTSDNGGFDSYTSNRPLREGKGENYEGGIREPWVFWWPGSINPGVSVEPIVTHDLYPTLLSVAGATPPDGHVVHGQDLNPLLSGDAFVREAPFIFHYPHWSNQGGSPYSAIRKGDWKLIYEYHTASWELYNLSDDIGETTNLITSRQDHHSVLSWMLSDGLLGLDANYPRNISSLVEEPPEPLVNPYNDADGDGSDDLDEMIFGTDKNNAADFFSFTASLSSPDSLLLNFTREEGRTYFLEASENLLPGSWKVIHTWEQLPSSQPGSFADSFDSDTRRFYRIKADFP